MRTSTRLAAIVGAPLLGLSALALAPRPVDLLVVNPGPRPRTVRVSGLPPVEVRPGECARLEVGAGAHLLVAEDVEGGVDRVDGWLPRLPFERRPTWVWSVAPVESAFFLVAKGYGDQDGLLAAEPWVAPGPVFRLPEAHAGVRLLPRADEELPNEVPAAPGETTGAVRMLLCTTARLDRLAPRTATLLVQNPLQTGMRLKVGEREVGVIAPRGSVEVSDLPPGPVSLEALELGPQGQDGRRFRAEVTLEVDPYFAPPACWVWSVARLVPKWVVLCRVYGDPTREADRPALFEPKHELFRLPPGWYPRLNQPFPVEWRRRGPLFMLWSFDHFMRERMAEQTIDLGSTGIIPPEERESPLDEAPTAEESVPTDEAPFPPVGPR